MSIAMGIEGRFACGMEHLGGLGYESDIWGIFYFEKVRCECFVFFTFLFQMEDILYEIACIPTDVQHFSNRVDFEHRGENGTTVTATPDKWATQNV